MNQEKQRLIRLQPEQQRSRKRVDQIIEATKELLVERGLGITMTNIAETAGMKVTALYRYFPNKQAVFREMALKMFEADQDAIIETMVHSELPIERILREATLAYWQLHTDEPYRLALYVAIQADPVLADLNLRDTRINASNLAQQVAAAIQTDDLVRIERRLVVNISLAGAVIQLASLVEESEAEQMMNDFIEFGNRHLLQADYSE